VRRVVGAVLGARQSCETDDVTQQAMLAVVLALPSFRGECEPAHFASRIAARTAIAAARRARAAMSTRDDGADLDVLEADSAPPSRQASTARHAVALRELLTRIAPEQAETIALRVVLGYSLAEVAEATGVPLNTVRSRMRLAKMALRAAIEADPAMAELEAWARD
jgi:RNA polymerase sigma-70 factor (ECF subfamily)